MRFKRIGGWGIAALMVATLAGCGGGGGGDGVAAPAGGGGGGGAAAATAVAVPPPAGPVVDVTTLTTTQFAALAPTGAVTGVSIASPPVVTFQVTDANGKGLAGLGFTSKKTTDTVSNLQNMSFTLAKLVPGTNGSPSKWVSYLVKSAATTTAASAPRRPSWETFGTLVDNGDGTYKYTFYTDITTVKDFVAAATLTAPNVAADLGDLTYDPTKLHRLVIRVGGNARGTGTNTADGSNSGVTAVPIGKALNIVFDWYPSTGKVVGAEGDPAGRDIVKVSACFECHEKFTFHGGSMQDTRFCATCHTEQRRYGRTEATISGSAFSGSTYVVDGRTIGWLPNYVHKIHMGHKLTKTGYNFANVKFNEITYPQSITNCTKCHDGSETAKNKTLQGDNWKKVPSRLACGSCHDGINFATGKGLTLADAEDGLTSSTYGHIGGIQTDDSRCALCHAPEAIETYHVTVDYKGSSGRGGYPTNTAKDTPTPGYPSGQGPAIPLASQLRMPAGVYKMDFEIKQVTVSGASGAKKATVVYRILKDGQPVTLNNTGYLIDGVDGSPNIMLAYAVPQDGIASPSDWNVPLDLGGGAKVIDIRDGKNGHSQTGPDASGYYTATLANIIPDNATMVTAAMPLGYQGFVQLNHSDYPKGIRLRESKFVMKTADGYTARRSVVDGDKCNKCHGQLGVSPSFHAGARNNGAGCVLCHNPNRATGHVGPSYQFGGGWFVGIKNLVHSIHASAKREKPFNYLQDEGTKFDEVTFPGILKNCETCHLAGTYDFSASASSAALPNLLWATDVARNMTNDATTNPTGITPVGQNPWIKILGDGEVDYTTDNLVSSPIASACFGCHDSTLAVQHMQSNGGTLLKRFSSVSSLGAAVVGARPVPTAAGVGNTTAMTFTKTEQCTLCHTTGKVADIKAMHAK